MNGTHYMGDGFFYSPQMAEAAYRLEAMTNPMFYPGSCAGAAYLRGGCYASGAKAGIMRTELPERVSNLYKMQEEEGRMENETRPKLQEAEV